jgi:polar amino acid transport system ATP-binding protein
VQKRERREARQQAEALLARVGLLDRRDAFPRQLSGGQQQRIAIVRSLCMNPQVMLFDEVTAALDPEMVKEVLQVIQGLARDGMTLLIVTHEMAFARAVADRVVFMGAGRIVEQNPPEIFFTNPQTARAQQFLEKFSFVETLPKKAPEKELERL